jgi:AcrR family transcriptional regulator
MSKNKFPAKKKRKPHRRRDYVVQKILRAALAELEARGAGAFRVENVARAADVNKTTIYRRWPTKEQLVKAALAAAGRAEEAAPAGSSAGKGTREDFLRLSAGYVAWQGSEVGRAVARLEREGGASPVLRKLIRDWQAARRKPLAQFLRRRGEAAGLRTEVFLQAWTGALRAYAPEGEAPARALAALADLLLHAK